MFPSLDQLLDPLTLLVVGAIAVAVGVLVGRASKRVRRAASASAQRRLAIVESLDLDAHRRLVILRRDAVEHLVLVGGSHDLVIEADISPAADRRLADLPVTRGARADPEDFPRALDSPAFREAPDLARNPVALEPQRGMDFSNSYSARREPPPTASAPVRAAHSPAAGDGRGASPAPEPTAARSTPYRAPPFPRARPTPAADAPRVEAPVSRRSLATPVHRSTPPLPVPQEQDHDSPRDHVTDVGSGQDATNLPAPGEPAAAEAFAPEEARPAPPAAATAAEETSDLPSEPEASAAPPDAHDPIDRLEAEIARLLGRVPAG